MKHLDAQVDKLANRIQQAVVKQLDGKVDGLAGRLEEVKRGRPTEIRSGRRRRQTTSCLGPDGIRPTFEVAIASDTSADTEVTKAQLHDISDKIDDLAKTLKKDLPERQAVKESSAEAIGHLNARVDGLADRIQEVESANTRTRSLEIEALPPVGQVQLVNAKADMQQAILTAALGARAQIQGKVDASDHMRAELLHGLNVSLESAMAQEQSTLQRSEADVAETAREAVNGTLTSILKASMDKVLGVGLAAASLTSEAESLQGNATALLDQAGTRGPCFKTAQPCPG
ncbi:for [Symbiodinium sp. CCMP2456]|nr:for [Symbiodinium sp. CCMP2456]